ncbi:MAG: lysylphosphatidylglycerol synthase transmembrane domain-containing protein [Alphaproteobacteria bacterium]
MRWLRLVLRWLVPALGAAAAIGVLFWLYRDLDFDRFVAGLARAKPWWLVALAGTILAEQLLRGWKWRQILHDLKPISSWRLFGAILAGYGVGTLIPLGVSPIVRSWLIARLENLRLASVLVTAAIERFIDGVVFAAIVGVVALAGQIPNIEGGLRTGLAVAGALNLALFGALLWLLFSSRGSLDRSDAPISRALDWLASKGGGRLAGIRSAIAEGIVWPRARLRRWGVIGASVGMKAIAASHFLWAGLAIGVVLRPFDYLFLLVFAGFALVLARFIRVPGGFVIGAGFALKTLGVADEAALAMILFNNTFSILLMVGVGLMVFWRSNVKLRTLARAPSFTER